ncbi:beta-glucanase [Streptomyces sp. NPDC002766]|uniref:beta-glucanase n=1 Tax=Streptomyces sp. NPDC002766 TaxID=3154429 RepID=UPI00331654E8
MSDVVFTADFTSERQWVAGRSWAYPDGGPTNPGDNKLDYLTADPAYSRTGTFRATRRTDGWWNAGLLTTEGSDEGFMVRTGDRLQARVCLPTGLGAWPAIWTWRDGGNEVDVFEYHPDNPDLLELSNHVRQGHSYLRHPAVGPGATIDLQVTFGRRDVVWSLNGTQVFADGHGVGARWHAYLIVNLSVCAGRYHPRPDPTATELSYCVETLTVHRPSAPTVPHPAVPDARSEPATETGSSSGIGTGPA